MHVIDGAVREVIRLQFGGCDSAAPLQDVGPVGQSDWRLAAGDLALKREEGGQSLTGGGHRGFYKVTEGAAAAGGKSILPSHLTAGNNMSCTIQVSLLSI